MQVVYSHPGLSPQQHQQQQAPPPAALVTSTSDNSGSGSFMLASYGGSAQPGPGMPSPIAQPQQQQAYMLSPQVMQPMFIPQLPSPQAVGMGMQQQGAARAAGLQQLGRAGGDGSMDGPMVQLSLQVTGSQFGVISNQLYSISAMSGADLSSAPVAAGLFHINITGAEAQVSAARQLITSVLSQVM